MRVSHSNALTDYIYNKLMKQYEEMGCLRQVKARVCWSSAGGSHYPPSIDFWCEDSTIPIRSSYFSRGPDKYFYVQYPKF